MQITRQSEYAIKTMLELARAPAGELLSTRYISELQEIPEDFLKKTIKLLVLSKLVATQRGVNGGVRLNKPPEEISLLDIITAIEGPLALNVCLSPGYKCANQPYCPVSRVLHRAQKALAEELNKSTLASMLAE